MSGAEGESHSFDVSAILFDIDGTLVDSTAAVERAWRATAHRYRIDVDELMRVCHGRRAEDTITRFVALERRAEALAFHDHLELHDLDGVVALPGAAALLSRVPSARWAAVTSGSRALMTARLRAAGLPVPAVLVTADDVREGKPAPEGYLAAASTLGVDPTRCLVIEDAPAGIAAGQRSGARTLAVATSHDGADLTGATTVVADLRAIGVEVRDDCLRITIGPR